MYYTLPLYPRTNHSLLLSMLRYRHMTRITLLNHQHQQLSGSLYKPDYSLHYYVCYVSFSKY